MASRRVCFERVYSGDRVVRIVEGDITEEEACAIVNAANERLAHGGGVAGAIDRKGGPSIQEESDRWVAEHGPVWTGSAAVTGAGALRARMVIHAVGPVWGDGDEERSLAAAVTSALDLAAARGARTLAMPAISTGIFGFPMARAAAVILAAVETWLAAAQGSLREVRVVLHGAEAAEAFTAEARRRAGGRGPAPPRP